MSDMNSNAEVTKKTRGPRSKQKLKIMYLGKIFKTYTDESHDITLEEIISKLDAYGVTSERKSLYDDIKQLEEYGYEIEKTQYNKTFHYKLVNRYFKFAELKLLIDAVQSAKLIPEDITSDLIKKLENLTSKANASQMQRQVYVNGRVKTINRDILDCVDALHNAIAQNMQVSFTYFNWTVQKKQEYRHDGARYKISPWGLLWDNENYYMIGYDPDEDKIKHYRVDKMSDVKVETTKREGRDKFDKIDMADYAKKRFSMFDGPEYRVTLICENYLAGVMIDRFGQDIHMLKVDDEHFKVSVKVCVSNHFLGWIFALGAGVKIEGPDAVIEMMKDEIHRIANQYD